MPDNLADKGPLDGKFISLSEPWEVAYWTEALGQTEEELKGLVAEYGPSVEAIRKALECAPPE